MQKRDDQQMTTTHAAATDGAATLDDAFVDELEAELEVDLDLVADLDLTLGDADEDEEEHQPSFAELGVADDLIAALAANGIDEPFAVQILAIPDAMAGLDVCGKAKTGSGKTLAFGIPTIERTKKAPPRSPGAMILVPTRELAVQVTEGLTPLCKARGLRMKAVYGGMPMPPQIDALNRGVDVLVATPGRLIDLIERGNCSVANVRTVVLDEADQMADMGFLPQVENILRRVEVEHQTMLFSATLDGAVGHLVRRWMRDPVNHEVESKTVTVDEMEHRFLGVHGMDRAKIVKEIAANADRVLVFVRTKFGVAKAVQQLSDEGVRAGGLHGGLPQVKRQRTLDAFAKGKLNVLVATDVAARGLHIDGLDVVIHWDPPEDTKAYLHRSGRTARAGEKGLVVTLVVWDKRFIVQRLKKQLGLQVETVEMFSNDERLADLATWQPPALEAEKKASAGARRRAMRRKATRRR